MGLSTWSVVVGGDVHMMCVCRVMCRVYACRYIVMSLCVYTKILYVYSIAIFSMHVQFHRYISNSLVGLCLHVTRLLTFSTALRLIYSHISTFLCFLSQ